MKTYHKPQLSSIELCTEEMIALSTNKEQGGKQLSPSKQGWNSDNWSAMDEEE